MRNNPDCINQLQAAGIAYDDAVSLRRISMTLHRWHELECGDSNDYASWCITRGRKVKLLKDHIPTLKDSRETFEHDENGKPYLERHSYALRASAAERPLGHDRVTYTLLPDRERGALKRLAKIMARYPGFASYVQGDPRRCALYIMRPGDMPAGASLDSCYNRGIAVYK